MENIKQKIIAVIILILVVAGLIWLTMFLKNKNTNTETGEKTGIALFTKKNPGTKQVKNQGSIGSENDNDLTGNDTTKPVSIIENIIQTITGNKDPITTNSTSVSENKSIGQAIRDFFLGNDGLPASQTDFQAETQDLSSRDPLALFSEEESAFVEPLTEEDDSIGRECKPKEYISKITRKNELEEQIKKGTRKKESLSDDEKDLIAWKPSKEEIDEDDMRRVLERNWDMWSYPTSYLKDCQWAGYEDKDASQAQNSFEKAKREVRDTFASISIMVGSQYTYQEAQNFLLTTRSTIDRYKDTISDCRLVRGLFEDPSGTTTGVRGYPYNWTNTYLEERKQQGEEHYVWSLHSEIRKDIAERVKKGDLKNKIKNEGLRAELGITDDSANQSALSTPIKNFTRNDKKIVNTTNYYWDWDGKSSTGTSEQQFHVVLLDNDKANRMTLDTDTTDVNDKDTLQNPNNTVCSWQNDDECGGNGHSVRAANNFPGIYMVRLPQSIWDILRQDQSKNLFCTMNKMMHTWAFQEQQVGAGMIAFSHIKNLESYGVMCDNNFIQDERVNLFYKKPALVVTTLDPLTITVDSERKAYRFNPYYDTIDPGPVSSDTGNPWVGFTTPTYFHGQPALFSIADGDGKDFSGWVGVLDIITTRNRDNWYSLSPIKARYDFFKDDE